jgi:N6-L-threonylcarbamoyladenine synthase
MRIMALESSCDETACAIIDAGRRVLANVVWSQIKTHAQYGGVIPELAAREHVQRVNSCVQAALDEAQLSLDEMDAFAATLGPGLVGSLLVAANAAKTLSLLTGKPFLGVNHLYGHVASNYLETDLTPPYLCLLVSGGHTQLIAVESYAQMRIVGESLDDAVGEAYDKVARMMALPFPGGPALDKLSKVGNPHAYKLPIARTERPFDFSFSGLKTACLKTYTEATMGLSPESSAFETIKADLAASFQHTVVETLFVKTLKCLDHLGYDTITIGGGVSANTALRQRFMDWAATAEGKQCFIPPFRFCTDNAAMIGASAFFNPITTDLAMEVFSRSVA